MRAAAALAAAVAVTACAAAPRDGSRAERALARELDGRTAGPAQRCLPTFQADNLTIAGSSLVYRGGRAIWVSAVPDCPGLVGDPILIVERFGTQLCENDPFRTAPRGGIAIPGPFCRFGPFVPYRKPR